MTRFVTRGLAGYLIVRPGDSLVVARAGWRLRRGGWWRRAPFLPLPDRRYWAFRMATAYGSADASPPPRAVVEAAAWSLRQRAEG